MDCLHVHKVHELLYLAICRSGLPADRHIAVFHTGRLLPAADHKIIILSMFIRKTDIKAEIRGMFVIGLFALSILLVIIIIVLLLRKPKAPKNPGRGGYDDDYGDYEG